jgi:hypothetical protein
MERHIKHVALLKRMFTESEWQLLLGDRYFNLALVNSGQSLDDIEKLATLGEQRLQTVKRFPEPLP